MAATPDNHQQRIALTDAFVIGRAATRSILGDLPVAGLSREELGRWAAPGAARPGEFGRTWSRLAAIQRLVDHGYLVKQEEDRATSGIFFLVTARSDQP